MPRPISSTRLATRTSRATFSCSACTLPAVLEPCCVPHGAKRQYCSAPPVDDPQLRVDLGCRHSAPVHSAHVVRPALAFPACLHYGLLAVLGSQCARRRVDGAQTRLGILQKARLSGLSFWKPRLQADIFSIFLFPFSIF